MATREDVAKYAGVSKTTVSRYLNKNGYVSPDAKEKIEKAIKELGYVPNMIARSLKTRETRQIVFHAPELHNPFYTEVYRGMEDYLDKNGYVIVVSRKLDNEMIRQRQMDGIILSHLNPDEQSYFREIDIPVVVTNYTFDDLDIPFVGINIRQGAEQAVEYLISCGHKTIGYMAPFEDNQRFEAYKSVLKQHSLPLIKDNIIICNRGCDYYEKGYNAAMTLAGSHLVTKNKISALFVFNDAMAIGAMAAFGHKGIKIPGDLSIVGFDNIIQSKYVCPALTTVDIPKYDQGKKTAEILLNLIRNKENGRLILDTELIVRDSVKKV